MVGDIAREILEGRQVGASSFGASVPEFAGNLFRMSVCNAEDFEFRVFLDLDLFLDFGLLVDFDLMLDLTELTCICLARCAPSLSSRPSDTWTLGFMVTKGRWLSDSWSSRLSDR